MKSRTVRIGIIGLGNMGKAHATSLLERRVKRCELAAVCDSDPGRLVGFSDNVRKFEKPGEMMKSGAVDAVLIATPHYGHTDIGIEALGCGLHVLVEKPISAHKADAERLIAAHRRRDQVFAAMFNQRTDPHYIKVKGLLDRGELGDLVRVNWIITTWFRTEHYYATGNWRATWAGEGGGALLNQCPHQLDLIQWMCGMPRRIHGFCGIGKRHNIEVEDEVTAYFEYANGATGVFITSTGEAPGTNRLEIAGDLGRVVVENGAVQFDQNEMSAREFSRTVKKSFTAPKARTVRIPAEGHGGQHAGILQNFVDAILKGEPLIAPAREGIRSVELANAILYSSMTGKPVDLPLDGKAYERLLKKLVRESRIGGKTAVGAKVAEDMSKSF